MPTRGRWRTGGRRRSATPSARIPKTISPSCARGIDGPEHDPAVAADPIDEPGPSFWFNLVAEPKRVKNRVHVDVHGGVEELAARGATIVERHERWTVMADPEGNEFCAFPEPGDER